MDGQTRGRWGPGCLTVLFGDHRSVVFELNRGRVLHLGWRRNEGGGRLTSRS